MELVAGYLELDRITWVIVIWERRAMMGAFVDPTHLYKREKSKTEIEVGVGENVDSPTTR